MREGCCGVGGGSRGAKGQQADEAQVRGGRHGSRCVEVEAVFDEDSRGLPPGVCVCISGTAACFWKGLRCTFG